MVGQIFMSLMGLVIIFLLFLICREMVCWYWKINESIKQREQLIDLNSQILAQHHRVVEMLSIISTQLDEGKGS